MTQVYTRWDCGTERKAPPKRGLLLLVESSDEHAEIYKVFASAFFAALFVFAILIIVAAIVRKVSFANNVLVGKIMAASIALVLFVIMILSMEGAGGKYLLVYVLWIIALAGLVANPLLSSPLKQ